ncbi:MAG: GNAT family N-acetyltransferase [Defluviitaleaceae bacterium]|nr:GNAT family N-acetyltransferase [Defluviitaleaceae bacterium]
MLIYKIDEDVTLRMFNIGDSKEYFQLVDESRIYLEEWASWVKNVHREEDMTVFINEDLEMFVENGGYPTSFVIIYQGKLAGSIAFHTINKKSRIGVVGYSLGKKYQGKGIMTKSLRVLLSYGFKELNLNKIEIKVATENKKSIVLPEKFGFTKEGVSRQAQWLYDHYVDHVCYGLLAEEWKDRQA